jgi:hypothetical protein
MTRASAISAATIAVTVLVAACAQSAADVGVNSLPAVKRPMARAAADFFEGLEKDHARQFCGAIVGRVGKRLTRVDPDSCVSDFKRHAFDSLLGAGKLKRVLGVDVSGERADVHLAVRVKGTTQHSILRVVHAYGRWRVPIPAGT